MSIADKITRLTVARNDIRTALNGKGVEASDHGFEDFADDIDSISGGPVVITEDDVNFWDYDGTLIKSYSSDAFANVSSLPSNPTHEGLTAEGWNWSLADAKQYVASYGGLDIGQNYITNDGKTRLYIEIDDLNYAHLEIELKASVANAVTIDWGDESSVETVESTDIENHRHDYAAIGNYVIKISVSSGTVTFASATSGSPCMHNAPYYRATDLNFWEDRVKKIEFGTGVIAGQYAFYRTRSLEYVSFGSGISISGDNAFCNCFIRCVVIPDGTTVIPKEAFNGMGSGGSVLCVPNSVTAARNSAFSYNRYLKRLFLPENCTIGKTLCYENNLLETAVIPSGRMVDGTSTTSINTISNEWNIFWNCYHLHNVVFGGSIGSTYKQIPNGMFASAGPHAVESHWYELPDDIQVISTGAFRSSAKETIKNKAWPQTIVAVGDLAFYNEKLPVLMRGINLPLLGSAVLTYIGDQAFQGTNITSVSNLGSITAVGHTTTAGRTFDQCQLLTSVTLPSTCKTLWSNSFSNCRSLRTINIDNITAIKSSVFAYDSALNVTATCALTELGASAFAYTYTPGRVNNEIHLDLGSSTFAAIGTNNMNPGTFEQSALVSINLPTTCKTIYNRCFYAYVGSSDIRTKLTTVTQGGGANGYLPNITTINTQGFDCTTEFEADLNLPALTTLGGTNHFSASGITSIVSLGSITSIPNGGSDTSGSFASCSNLTSVALPSTLTTIGKTAFYNCTALTNITGGTAVKTLGNRVFMGCTSLPSIPFQSTLTSIGELCFYNTPELGIEINMPNLTTIGVRAFDRSGITKIVNLGKITSIPDAGNNTRSAFGFNDTLTEVVLPSTLKTIGNYAFRNATALTTVTIPSGVTSIGNDAFHVTAIERIEVPATVTSLGNWWFNNTSAEAPVVIMRKTTPPTLGTNAFTSNHTIYVPAGTSAAYKAATNWKTWASKIFELDSNGNIPA